jgi:hypothetical protein
LFVVVWLAAFAVQSADVLALVADDACAADVSGTESDPCPDGCSRCLCCARVPVFVPQIAPGSVVQQAARLSPIPFVGPTTTPSPHGVYHVPKHS